MSVHEITLSDPAQSKQLAADPDPMRDIRGAMPKPEDKTIVRSQKCPSCGATALEATSKGTRDSPTRVNLHTKCGSCAADVDIVV